MNFISYMWSPPKTCLKNAELSFISGTFHQPIRLSSGSALVLPFSLATSPHVLLHQRTELKVIIRTCVLASTLQSQLNRPETSGGFVETRAPEGNKHHENNIKTRDRKSGYDELPLRILDHLQKAIPFITAIFLWQ